MELMTAHRKLHYWLDCLKLDVLKAHELLASLLGCWMAIVKDKRLNFSRARKMEVKLWAHPKEDSLEVNL